MHGSMLGRGRFHQELGDVVGPVHIVWKKVQEPQTSHKEKGIICGIVKICEYSLVMRRYARDNILAKGTAALRLDQKVSCTNVPQKKPFDDIHRSVSPYLVK